MTHAYLTDLDEAGMHREIVNAKQQLEEITGCPVLHYSCPGGRYDQRVIETAQHAGFRTLATSRTRANPDRASLFELGRIVVMRQTSLPAFGRICRNQGLWKLRLRDLALTGVKRGLGNSNYDKLRGIFLTGQR
jgi:peptidoglycan/xylan/chitin deacetylase (PgdA/CDA1 family)